MASHFAEVQLLLDDALLQVPEGGHEGVGVAFEPSAVGGEQLTAPAQVELEVRGGV